MPDSVRKARNFMKKILKTLIVSLLSAALLCCTLPAAFAADTTAAKEAEIYTIGLDAMGGTTSTVVVTTNLNGRLSALPETPTLEGYTFDGWYTEPVGGTKISTATVFTGSTTVYAHWTVKSTGTSSATTTTKPTQTTESPAILDHLGGFVIVGVLVGTLLIASAMSAPAATA